MSLTILIDDPGADIGAIARHLDRSDPAERSAEVLALGRDRQRMLYEKAAAAPALDLDHFVGRAGARVEVIHDGLNTLPLPPRLRRFQKRFCRPERGGARLFGYNEGPTRKVVGPGYFVALATDGRPHWQTRGAVVIDYFQVPDGAVAEGWPAVVANDWRLQRFVYHETRDFMRRVSSHVSIGAAFKRERPLDHYFVLCRRDGDSAEHASA
ncbi:MAG TPA: hypothetical protein VKB80_33645 [Kofleriaceae bacterium]|nr:hypothetical protein [Kofleriaceae bacterium]